MEPALPDSLQLIVPAWIDDVGDDELSGALFDAMVARARALRHGAETDPTTRPLIVAADEALQRVADLRVPGRVVVPQALKEVRSAGVTYDLACEKAGGPAARRR